MIKTIGLPLTINAVSDIYISMNQHLGDHYVTLTQTTHTRVMHHHACQYTPTTPQSMTNFMDVSLRVLYDWVGNASHGALHSLLINTLIVILQRSDKIIIVFVAAVKMAILLLQQLLRGNLWTFAGSEDINFVHCAYSVWQQINYGSPQTVK